MNGEVCCILGVCCPPQSKRQRDALSLALQKELDFEPHYCDRVAHWLVKNFDLAPVGTLTDFKKAMVKLGKQHPEGT